MSGIIFYYEDSDIDVWSGKNLDAWNYAAKIGEIDSLIVINKTDQELKNPNVSLNFKVINDISELKVEGLTVALRCPWESEKGDSLWEFNHDVNWYIIGPAAGWNSVKSEYKNFDYNIHIPQGNKIATHSIHVATTVMFDRYNKLNN